MIKKPFVSPKVVAPKAPIAPAAPVAVVAPRNGTERQPATIDYPQDAERVFAGNYTIRISATGAGEAQVSVDGGEWQGCREAAGYFWYDWAPVAGRHKLEVRVRSGKGRWKKGESRSCDVSGS